LVLFDDCIIWTSGAARRHTTAPISDAMQPTTCACACGCGFFTFGDEKRE